MILKYYIIYCCRANQTAFEKKKKVGPPSLNAAPTPDNRTRPAYGTWIHANTQQQHRPGESIIHKRGKTAPKKTAGRRVKLTLGTKTKARLHKQTQNETTTAVAYIPSVGYVRPPAELVRRGSGWRACTRGNNCQTQNKTHATQEHALSSFPFKKCRCAKMRTGHKSIIHAQQ